MTKQLNTRKKLFSIFVLAAFFSGGGLMGVTAMSAASESEGSAQKVASAPAAGDQKPVQTTAAQDKPFLDYDVVMGDPEAPIEIIEYASTTCPHCADFHENVLPQLKEKYIETGKAKLIYRHFMLNAIDLDVSIISRCATEDKYYPLLGLIFKRQSAWFQPQEYRKLADQYGKETGYRMFSEFTRNEVAKIARMAGISKSRMEQCLTDSRIRDYLIDVYQEGAKTYQITGTPSFVINGEKFEGRPDFESLDKALQKLN
tara:strand:- start:12285 stop:13058 length:774 start_codon:yes stop_codon:yes gene_type:complete